MTPTRITTSTESSTVSNSKIAVDLDCELTPELIRGGYAREMVNRIQRARKDRGFEVSDRICVVYSAAGQLAQAADEHEDYIKGEVLALEWLAGEPETATAADIDGMPFSFSLSKA